jgi:hypothetical protein
VIYAKAINMKIIALTEAIADIQVLRKQILKGGLKKF